MNPPKAERAKPSLSSDYNLLFKNKIGERSLDIHRSLRLVMGLRFPLLGSVPQTACSLAILSQYEIVDLPIEYCSTASEMLSSLLGVCRFLCLARVYG